MVKFLSKFRRGGGGDDTPDSGVEGGPTRSSPSEPETEFTAPGPAAESSNIQEPSSFQEPSFDAEPIDVPVFHPPEQPQPQPPVQPEEEKKSRFPRFRKNKQPKEAAVAPPAPPPIELQPVSHDEGRYFPPEVGVAGDSTYDEQVAMDTFQQRIHQSRAAGYSQYGINRAPGFDYLNWRPYGYPRYPQTNPESYLQQIHALVPYVYDVVVSGCAGVEEKRWDALTKSADTKAESAQATRDNSAMGSRTESRDRLVSN